MPCETHLLQSLVKGLSINNVVQSQACLLFRLVCQLQSVWLDKTSMKLADLQRDSSFHGTENLLQHTHVCQLTGFSSQHTGN